LGVIGDLIDPDVDVDVVGDVGDSGCGAAVSAGGGASFAALQIERGLRVFCFSLSLSLSSSRSYRLSSTRLFRLDRPLLLLL
jgi:hypothetical protein